MTQDDRFKIPALIYSTELRTRFHGFVRALAKAQTIEGWIKTSDRPTVKEHFQNALTRALEEKAAALQALQQYLTIGTTAIPGFLINFNGETMSFVVIFDETSRQPHHQ